MPVARKPGPALAGLQALIAQTAQHEARVGYFADAKYDDGTPVAGVAAVHEYGYAEGGIPPRPTMRPTVEARKADWVRTARQGALLVSTGRAQAKDVLEMLAASAAGDVRKAVTRLQSPPLAASTVAARMRKYTRKSKSKTISKPLVDTGLMLASLTHMVVTK